MIDRRAVLTGGVLGSVMGVLGGETAAAQSSGSGSGGSAETAKAVEQIVDAVGQLRAEVRNQRQFTEIAPLRE
jgi:hypothetical protein